MRMDFRPLDRMDKIAELTRTLTYGEMIQLAAELWKAAGAQEITAENLAEVLHRWACDDPILPYPLLARPVMSDEEYGQSGPTN
jgi:hypothetical protein